MTSPYTSPRPEANQPPRGQQWQTSQQAASGEVVQKPARKFSLWRVETPELDEEQRTRFLANRRRTRWVMLFVMVIPMIVAGVWATKHIQAYASTASGISSHNGAKYPAAIGSFEHVVDLDVSRQRAEQHYNLGTAHHFNLNFSAAVSSFEEALLHVSRDDAEMTCRIYINYVHATTGLAQDFAALGQDYGARALELQQQDDPSALDDLGYSADAYQQMSDDAFQTAADGFADAQDLVLLRRVACDEADPPQSQQEQQERDQEQEEELEGLQQQQQDAEQNQSDPPPLDDGQSEEEQQSEEERRQEELDKRNSDAQQNREDYEEELDSNGDSQGDVDQDSDGENDNNGEGGEGEDQEGEGGSSQRTPKW